MHKIKRKELFVNELKGKKFVTTKEFIKFALTRNINEATTRRDLKELEIEGIVTLSFGGITVNLIDETELSVDYKMEINYAKKVSISKLTNSLLNNLDVIFCAAGSTMEIFVKLINKKIRTLVTNSLAVFEAARNNSHVIDVVLIGGLFREKSKVFFSRTAADHFQEFKLDKVFFSCLYFDENGDIYDDFAPEVDLIVSALANAKNSILLADSAKFKSVGLNKITNLSEITHIVTNNDIDKNLLLKFNNILTD
ncbi:DeoR/GlpR family DNA-binding transcription regulator [Spiroplasma culicicola]|uniref:DeoR family transcriptional regulator, lactose phosphotransferase system repressor n=1 Tax=Spiroplasma culicicola AES-1 TaxID=1276246 RepID=W6A7R2_9MOLU|nr:DeoR/GlpR family DNA-binding transcription regulator [Spiroplasma culicicola]AHI53026.1 DeoR family transcriptional regulator, lactose phosphotransferase system repressor [Spiroplasma culicicola AES-1]